MKLSITTRNRIYFNPKIIGSKVKNGRDHDSGRVVLRREGSGDPRRRNAAWPSPASVQAMAISGVVSMPWDRKSRRLGNPYRRVAQEHQNACAQREAFFRATGPNNAGRQSDISNDPKAGTIRKLNKSEKE